MRICAVRKPSHLNIRVVHADAVDRLFTEMERIEGYIRAEMGSVRDEMDQQLVVPARVRDLKHKYTKDDLARERETLSTCFTRLEPAVRQRSKARLEYCEAGQALIKALEDLAPIVDFSPDREVQPAAGPPAHPAASTANEAEVAFPVSIIQLPHAVKKIHNNVIARYAGKLACRA
jgi:hypothetical protein